LGDLRREPALGRRHALAPEDALCTLAVHGPKREDLRVVGALRSLLVAPEGPERLIAAMRDPAARIVSLTITEKGAVTFASFTCRSRDAPGGRRQGNQ
jgi:mannitol-1-phosphate/altronate dehydrogenase